jgi:hypothetical protein
MFTAIAIVCLILGYIIIEGYPNTPTHRIVRGIGATVFLVGTVIIGGVACYYAWRYLV